MLGRSQALLTSYAPRRSPQHRVATTIGIATCFLTSRWTSPSGPRALSAHHVATHTPGRRPPGRRPALGLHPLDQPPSADHHTSTACTAVLTASACTFLRAHPLR